MSGNISPKSQLPAALAGDGAVFRCFPKLPFEVCTMIWVFACFLPRTIIVKQGAATISSAICRGRHRSLKVEHLTCPNPYPPLLHTCYQARKACIKQYQLLYNEKMINGVFKVDRIWVNEAVDILCPTGDFHHYVFRAVWNKCCISKLAFALSLSGNLLEKFWDEIWDEFWSDKSDTDGPAVVEEFVVYKGDIEKGIGLQAICNPNSKEEDEIEYKMHEINGLAIDEIYRSAFLEGDLTAEEAQELFEGLEWEHEEVEYPNITEMEILLK